MNQGWTYREQVHPRDAGLSLLTYYTQKYRHSSPQDWQIRIASAQIQVDGHPASPDLTLQAGQWLTYDRPPWEEPTVPLNFEVLFADQDILAIAKPAGLPVLPGGGFLQHTLLWQLRQHYPENPPIPIHRLGRGTSGLMLLARSDLARAHLSHQLRQSSAMAENQDRPGPRMQKTYRALIGAANLPDEFTLTYPIGKLPHPVLGYVYGATEQGRPAYSQGRVLKRTADTTLVEVTIRTGRPHQIRIHLATAGYPLLGDPLYQAGGVPPSPAADAPLTVPGNCGYHLHACHLVFIHPRTEQTMSLHCPPPKQLQR